MTTVRNQVTKLHAHAAIASREQASRLMPDSSFSPEFFTEQSQVNWDDAPPIRSFPASAMRLMQATKDENCETDKLVSIIECDPGYASQLLQIANSSLYGMSGRVGSVKQAVIVLGFRKLHNLAVSMAAADVFSQSGQCQQEREELWHHSLACAVTARQIATRVGISSDEAFLAGVLHDVGKLVMLDVVADAYGTAINEFDRLSKYDSLTALEIEAFGRDHQELGMDCADEWGLPFEMTAVIGHHHQPQAAPVSNQLCELTRLSNHLVDCWNLTGSRMGEQEPFQTELEFRLELSADVLSSVRDEVDMQYEDIRSVCSATT